MKKIILSMMLFMSLNIVIAQEHIDRYNRCVRFSNETVRIYNNLIFQTNDLLLTDINYDANTYCSNLKKLSSDARSLQTKWENDLPTGVWECKITAQYLVAYGWSDLGDKVYGMADHMEKMLTDADDIRKNTLESFILEKNNLYKEDCWFEEY